MKLVKAEICLEADHLLPDNTSPTATKGQVWMNPQGDFSEGLLAYFTKPDAEWHEAIYVPVCRVYWFRLLEAPR